MRHSKQNKSDSPEGSLQSAYKEEKGIVSEHVIPGIVMTHFRTTGPFSAFVKKSIRAGCLPFENKAAFFKKVAFTVGWFVRDVGGISLNNILEAPNR